jgi:hypothetical protein
MRYLRPCLGLCLAITLLTSIGGGTALAQGQPLEGIAIAPTGIMPMPAPRAPGQAQGPTTTVKLQVVLSRYEGDKKISSFPYTLSLVPGVAGSLRAGAEVPVATTSMGAAGSTPSYTMQQVGSQVDATVTPTADGKYNLKLSVTDRWSVTGAQAAPGGVPNVPSFRNMVSNSQVILSNGETMQFTSSADKASNETFKIDVTLTVGNK